MESLMFGAMLLFALCLGVLVGFEVGRAKPKTIDISPPPVTINVDWRMIEAVLESKGLIAMPKGVDAVFGKRGEDT